MGEYVNLTERVRNLAEVYNTRLHGCLDMLAKQYGAILDGSKNKLNSLRELYETVKDEVGYALRGARGGHLASRTVMAYLLIEILAPHAIAQQQDPQEQQQISLEGMNFRSTSSREVAGTGQPFVSSYSSLAFTYTGGVVVIVSDPNKNKSAGDPDDWTSLQTSNGSASLSDQGLDAEVRTFLESHRDGYSDTVEQFVLGHMGKFKELLGSGDPRTTQGTDEGERYKEVSVVDPETGLKYVVRVLRGPDGVFARNFYVIHEVEIPEGERTPGDPRVKEEYVVAIREEVPESSGWLRDPLTQLGDLADRVR